MKNITYHIGAALAGYTDDSEPEKFTDPAAYSKKMLIRKLEAAQEISTEESENGDGRLPVLYLSAEISEDLGHGETNHEWHDIAEVEGIDVWQTPLDEIHRRFQTALAKFAEERA